MPSVRARALFICIRDVCIASRKTSTISSFTPGRVWFRGFKKVPRRSSGQDRPTLPEKFWHQHRLRPERPSNKVQKSWQLGRRSRLCAATGALLLNSELATNVAAGSRTTVAPLRHHAADYWIAVLVSVVPERARPRRSHCAFWGAVHRPLLARLHERFRLFDHPE